MSPKISKRPPKISDLLFIIILIIGLIMRLYPFLMGRSLWEDEAHLALNFIYSDYAGLLKPLAHYQASPILFLFITETISLIFGFGEKALRAFPLFMSLGSFPLFYFIIKALTQNQIAARIGFFLLSVNLVVNYYASELHPYAIDLSVYLMLVFLTLSQNPFIQKNRIILLICFGTSAVFLSNASVIIMACVSTYFIFQWINNKSLKKSELLVLVIWGLAWSINYFTFIFNHPYAEGMKAELQFAFCPAHPLSCEFVTFMKNRIQEIFFSHMLYIYPDFGTPFLVFIIFIAGLLYMIKTRNYSLIIFSCLPIALHLLLSAFHLYPFYLRFILYLVPAFILILVAGLIYLLTLLKKLHLYVSTLFLLLCCSLFTFPSFIQYPLWFREVKPALDLINKDYPNTPIYITTPFTLYKYYQLTGYAKNTNYKDIAWGISPEVYGEKVETEKGNYLLFHATHFGVDGYKEVMEDLKKRNLVVREFEYKSYTVSEIKPAPEDPNKITLNYKAFPLTTHFNLDGDSVAAIWTGEIQNAPLLLKKGNYRISIISKGMALGGEFPKLSLYSGNVKIGEFISGNIYKQEQFSINIRAETQVFFSINLDNDATDPKKNEDRNAFIKSISITKTD